MGMASAIIGRLQKASKRLDSDPTNGTDYWSVSMVAHFVLSHLPTPTMCSSGRPGRLWSVANQLLWLPETTAYWSVSVVAHFILSHLPTPTMCSSRRPWVFVDVANQLLWLPETTTYWSVSMVAHFILSLLPTPTMCS